MAKFVINASGAMLLPSLVQVSESISGSVVPLAKFFEGPRIAPEQFFTLGKIIQSPYLVSGAECKAWIRVVLRRERG